MTMDPNLPEVRIQDDFHLWALFCHLSIFLSIVIPLANYIVPLVLWLLKRKESPLVDHHGKESINFQISRLIYGMGILVFLAFSILPWIFLKSKMTLALAGLLSLPVLASITAGLVLILAGIILPIVAGIKAFHREDYRYPAILRYVK